MMDKNIRWLVEALRDACDHALADGILYYRKISPKERV